LYRLCFDVAFVFQAGSDDGNLWLFNLKNGECVVFKRKSEAIEDIGKLDYTVWNEMK